MPGWFVRRRASVVGGSGGLGWDPVYRPEVANYQRVLSPRALRQDYSAVPVVPAGVRGWDPVQVGATTRQRPARAQAVYQDYGAQVFVIPFTPASATSATLIGWWKSDTGVYQNTAMTTPVTTDGQAAAGWQDQSGAGHHLTEATNAPAWKTGQVNGKPSVRFNGTSQLLTALFTLDVPFDLFVVVKQIGWVEGASIVCGGANDNFSLYQHAASAAFDIYNGATTGAHNTNLAAATWGLVEAGMPSGANCYTKVNNNAAVTGGAPASAARGGITLAAHPGAANFGNVEFAEVVLYSAILSGTDATSLRSYFTGRYGFP